MRVGRARSVVLLAACGAAASFSACGTSSSPPPGGTGPVGTVDGGGLGDAPVYTSDGGSPASQFAAKLGASHAGHFLVGMGNDGTNGGNDPAYALGVTLDLHYHYLVGLSTEGGWPTWNSSPDYAGVRIAEATSHGTIPMFACYCMVAHGENQLSSSIGDGAYMTVWWKDFTQLLGTIKAAASPVIVVIEPDFWGYLLQASTAAGGPDKVVAKVSASGATECAGEPDTVVGFGRCLVELSRARAPLAIIGFHASPWGTNIDVGRNTDPSLDVAGEANKTVAFFKAVGGDHADFIAGDLSDRDAGCYEVAGPNCGSTPRTGVYWDEANVTLPNFHQMLTWAKAITSGLGLPMLWWQLPFGVPSTTPGGTPGHFRDNRVHYVLSHTSEYVAAGGVGAAWGTGASGQTFIDGDNNEFHDAVSKYFQAPTPLP